jgi:glycerate 2-kinase
MGPVGQPVQAHIGFLGDTKTAVLEMATAAGLRRVPPEVRNPLLTTIYGVGQLIKAVLDAGAERLLIGCGDSGTNDGGVGMAQAWLENCAENVTRMLLVGTKLRLK